MRIVLIVLVFALTLYALLDCARTPDESMPARMPKYLWITLIVLFPTIGPIAWIIVSRVRAAEERGGYVEPTVWSSREAGEAGEDAGGDETGETDRSGTDQH